MEQSMPQNNPEERKVWWDLVKSSRFLSGDKATLEVLQSGKLNGEPVENLEEVLAAREAVLEFEFAKKQLEDIEMKNSRAVEWAKEAGSGIEYAPRPEMEKH